MFAKLFGRRSTEDLKTQEIGRVDTYFAKVGVVALKLKRKLEVGEEILIQGHTTDFVQRIKSMQIQHEAVDGARRGAERGPELHELDLHAVEVAKRDHADRADVQAGGIGDGDG